MKQLFSQYEKKAEEVVKYQIKIANLKKAEKE